ncbi:MAG: preprotein translocase subunit TatC [Brevundimonas sp.]|uniref:Group III truncated hemoglobin n=1 Tax=Brevundimonas albigilva TaxID=1312364 RepID=A0ABY4SMM4_9CAUL|nr:MULTISPECIES: group III truncated hemoglobin [Brevundimonas]PZU61990.1 MAG: preprotein translocase subunit TatC [Brevundimonas sp.]UQV18051.1 group III truncated hemoglobin [Brevundimonas albigilva]URI13960.1 group III truncated hemoglobin [Brevundimonas albigilva]
MQPPFRVEDSAGAAERRAAAVQRQREMTGVDEALIDRVVEAFYARVRDDALIGPIFADRVGDWGPHLAQMKRFWSSVVLASGVYQGRPMPRHLPLPIDARHFDRWLTLFQDTVRDLCPPQAAAAFMERARRIAESLELGVANAHGVLLAPGERFRAPSPPWTEDA